MVLLLIRIFDNFHFIKHAGLYEVVADKVSDIKLKSEVYPDEKQTKVERARSGWLPKKSPVGRPVNKTIRGNPQLREAHLASQSSLTGDNHTPNIIDPKQLKSSVLDLSRKKIPYIVYMRDKDVDTPSYKYEWLNPRNTYQPQAFSYTPENRLQHNQQSESKRNAGDGNKKGK